MKASRKDKQRRIVRRSAKGTAKQGAGPRKLTGAVRTKRGKAKEEALTRRLTVTELGSALNVTPRQVRTWIQKRCPSRRRKPKAGQGGPSRHTFDLEEVQTWLIARGIVPGATAPKPQPADGAPAVLQPIPGEDITDTLKRVRGIERQLYELCQNTTKAMLQAAYRREHRDTVEVRRKLEKDISGIRREAGDVIRLEAAEKIYGRMLKEIKAHFDALPRRLAKMLAGINRPAEVEALLRREHDTIWRRISGADRHRK